MYYLRVIDPKSNKLLLQQKYPSPPPVYARNDHIHLGKLALQVNHVAHEFGPDAFGITVLVGSATSQLSLAQPAADDEVLPWPWATTTSD